MLFFKDLVDEKMSDGDFKRVYDEECHICANTIRIVAAFEKDPGKLSALLESTGISKAQWDHLKAGDFCDPAQVYAIYEYLGEDAKKIMADCPRRC